MRSTEPNNQHQRGKSSIAPDKSSTTTVLDSHRTTPTSNMPRGIAYMGGQHCPPRGTSTKDISDEADTRARLDDFNNAWQTLRFGVVADVAW